MRKSTLRTWIMPTLLFSFPTAVAHAQMGGPTGDLAPAFSDPKFSDRMYEAGGRRVQEAKDGSVILSVTIEGNKSVSSNSIMSVMQSREDRIYDADTLNRDIASLYRTNLFKKIDTYFTEEKGGVHVKLVVQERPIVRSVLFTGNQALEDRALQKHAGIEKGDPLDPISINSARSRLIEYYQDQGMNQADVQVVSGLNPSERDVEFLINEGPVERFNKIMMRGNVDMKQDYLKGKIKSSDTRFGMTMFMFNIASDNKIETDRQLLVGFYRQLGYFDARVDVRKEYDKSGKWVDLTFIISEGERYKLGKVSIVGTKRYQPSELLPYMTSKENEYFNLGNKSADEKFLYKLYGTQGHYFCDVVGELVYQPGKKVDIVFNVAEGDIYRISDVHVHLDGEHTKERVVLHPLARLRPGSLLDSNEVDNATRRMKFSQMYNMDPSQGITPTIKVGQEDDLDLDR